MAAKLGNRGGCHVKRDDPDRFLVTGCAECDLRHLTLQDQARVRAAIDGLQVRPPAGDKRKLQGADEWRLRVGALRVRVDLTDDGEAVRILRVLPRGRAYRD